MSSDELQTAPDVSSLARSMVQDACVSIGPYRIPSSFPNEAVALFRDLSVRWNEAAGIGVAVPLPSHDDLAIFYRLHYRPLMNKEQGLARYITSPNHRAQAKSQLDWVDPWLPGRGEWLDVGAGYGLLLWEVHRRFPGWLLSALEPDRNARSDLASLAKVETATDEFWDAARPAQRWWDVVSASHVLEHLRDPWAGLLRLTEHVRPGGLLLLEVPNESLATLRRSDRANDLPHLWFFSPQGLERLVARAGMEVLRSGTIGLERPWAKRPVTRRLLRRIRRLTAGPLSRLDDRSWYAEGPERDAARVICRKPIPDPDRSER